jgi:hypothetical protein
METRITSLPEIELVRMGQRLRSAQLLQQASLTIPQSRAVGEPLAKLMRPGFIDLVEAVRLSVAKAFEDKSVLEEEAKLSTESQHEAMRLVKEWSRRAVARANSVLLSGATLPEQMAYIPDARSVPARTGQVQRLLGLLVQHAATMDKVGIPTQPLIDEGRQVLDALIAADSGQELKRAADLPASLANFYARKAELYTGLKMINEAAHELYAHDPLSSSRFNLSLLYRKGPATTTQPTPNAPPTAPISPSHSTASSAPAATS